MSLRVLISARTFGSTSPEPWDLLDTAGLETLRLGVDTASDDSFAAAFRDVDAAIVGSRPIPASVILGAPRLRVIAMHGVGVDHIDREAARAHGVIIANSPGANAESVADLAFGLLLAVARGIPAEDQEVRRGHWTTSLGSEIAGKTMGIVGLGRIGRAVASRARGFGMQVLGHDPYVVDQVLLGADVERVGLDPLFERSDVVSLHAPSTPETRGLVSGARLASMRPTALLINTSRGDLVDEDALHEALVSGRLAGAGLDTFAKEPPIGNRLLQLPNVVVTPHIGAHTREAVTRASVMAAQNVISVIRHGVAIWPTFTTAPP